MQISLEVKHVPNILGLELLFQGASKHTGVACCGCIIGSQNAVYLQAWCFPAAAPSSTLCSSPKWSLLLLLQSAATCKAPLHLACIQGLTASPQTFFTRDERRLNYPSTAVRGLTTLHWCFRQNFQYLKSVIKRTCLGLST